MIVNEPCGVVDFDALGLSIASRCIRKAFSNWSLTDAEGTEGAAVAAAALSEAAAASAAVVAVAALPALVDGLSAGIVESLSFGDVAASTAEVLPSSNPLALANRMLDGFLPSAIDGVHLPVDRAVELFHRPGDGLISGLRVLNVEAGCLFFVRDTILAVVCFSDGVTVAEMSSENAEGNVPALARIVTKERRIRLVLFNCE